MCLQLRIITVVGGVEVGIASHVHTAHGHRQLANVAHPKKVNLALDARQQHAVADGHMEARERQSALRVTQNVHAWPRSPMNKGIVDECHLVLGIHIVGLAHDVVTLNGHLSCHLQVFILVEQRVDGQKIFRLAQLCNALRPLLFQQQESGHTRCLSVARLLIIVVKHLRPSCLHTDNVEHVVAEDAAVDAVNDKRLIACGKSLGQLGGRCQRLVVPRTACCLCLSLVIAQLGINIVGFSQHRCVGCGKHRVALLCLGIKALKTVHARTQRVGRHTDLCIYGQHLRFEQMAVGTLCGGFVHNFLQHSQLRFGQISATHLAPLLPHRGVAVGKGYRWHEPCHEHKHGNKRLFLYHIVSFFYCLLFNLRLYLRF